MRKICALVGWTAGTTVLLVVGFGPALRAQPPDDRYVPSKGVVVFGGVRSPLVQSDDRKRLFALDVASGTPRVVWEGAGNLKAIRVSPSQDQIAFLELFWEENASPARANYVSRSYDEEGKEEVSRFFEDSILRIVDWKGELLGSENRVRRYVWSPDGAWIAFITGDYYEGGRGFRSSGTWIWDLGSQEVRRVAPRGHDLHWAAHDSALYVRDMGEKGVEVWRFLPSEGVLTRTGHQGIYFSPGGERYYTPSYEGTLFRLFESAGDQEITEEFPFLSSEEMKYAQPLGWYDDNVLIIPSDIPGSTVEYLYDLQSRRGRMARGHVLGWSPSSSNLVLILQGDSLESRDLVSLPLLERPLSRSEIRQLQK